MDVRTSIQHTDPTSAQPGPAPSRLSMLGVAVFSIGALAWLWLSLVAIANYSFRYPAFDQLRMYALYLSLPFPQDAIQLDNGHRPIVPTLLRLAEIRWMHANQLLQITVGCAAAVLSLVMIVMTIAREKSVPAFVRAACCLVATIALFWLGNGRMLMHGNEAIQVYVVVLFTVLAILAMLRAHSHGGWMWPLMAGVCCTVATFSFGNGIASFVSVFAIALVLLTRWKTLALPVAFLCGVLALYLLALPSGGQARQSLSFEPLSSAGLLLRWLSAPWMRAWLGYGDPSVEPSLRAAVASSGTIGSMLVSTARSFGTLLGNDWQALESIIVGLAGIATYVATVVHAVVRRATISRGRLLAIGLSTFALTTGALICVARLRAFANTPSDAYADRYLPWSCLFWAGLALYAGLGAFVRSRAAGFCVAVVGVSLVFLPSDRVLATWSAIVSRNIQQSAVAAQLGIWDPERFPDGPDAQRPIVLESLDRLKAAHLSMFAEPAFALVEKGWQPTGVASEPVSGAQSTMVRQFHDTLGRREVAAFDGVVPADLDLAGDTVLVVVDASRRLRGIGKFSFIERNASSSRWTIARLHGFDGYVLDPQPGELLQIHLLEPTDLSDLGFIPLQMPGAAITAP